jgi:hypothetical protein
MDVFQREVLAVIACLGRGDFDAGQHPFLRYEVDVAAVPVVEQCHDRVDGAEAAAEDDDGLIPVDFLGHAVGGVGRVEIAGRIVQIAEPIRIGRADRQKDDVGGGVIALDGDCFLAVDLDIDPGGARLLERIVENLLHIDAVFAALRVFDAIGIERRARRRAPRLKPGSEMTGLAVVEPHETGFRVQKMAGLLRAERQSAREFIVTLDQMDLPPVAWVIA